MSSTLKPTADNRRVVNTNFLFFCQIVLLIVPIAFLYAGLYFMNVSSPIIVAVCGVIIFGFLVIVICVQPFTTSEVKGDDTVPLTRDMSPSRKFPYSTGLVTGGVEEENQVPSSPHGASSKRPLPTEMMQKQHKETVNRSMIEACSCPHNPSSHTMNQGDGGELSDSSNSIVHSGKDSSSQSLISDSSDEGPKDCTTCQAKRSIHHTQSHSGNTCSSRSNDIVEKRGLLEKYQNSHLHANHQYEENVGLLDLPADKCRRLKIEIPKECTVSSNEGSANTGQPCMLVSPERTRKTNPVGQRPKTHELELRNDREPSPKAKRVLTTGPDGEPLIKQPKLSYSIAAKSRPTTPNLPVQNDQPSAPPYFTQWDKDRSSEPSITLRLFPLSSRQGVFEWVDPVFSPQHKNIPDGGLGSVICNMQKIELPETSNVTIDESSQTILPFNTDTLHQMMVSSLKESVKQFEDFGTQVEVPKITSKPSTIVYIIDEKNPTLSSTSLKVKEGESIRRKSSQFSRESGETSPNSFCQNKEQYQEALKSSTVCNDSILDFVMRRPFSGQSESPVKSYERGGFKSDASFSASNVHLDVVDYEKSKCISTSYDKVIRDSTFSTSLNTGSGRTGMWSSCHSSRELLQCDSPHLKLKQHAWKIQAKISCPNEESIRDEQSEERSKEYYMALYMGGKDKKYQPSRFGLLATESSKEDVLPGKRKASVSPRTKRKIKIKQDHYWGDNRLGGNIDTLQCSPRLGREHHKDERKLPDASASNTFDERPPGSCQPSPKRYDKSSNRHPRSPCAKSSPTSKQQQVSVRKQESPRRVTSRPKYDKDKPKGPADSKRGYSSFPPFNLDFSSSVNEDDCNKLLPNSRKSDQKGDPHVRKQRPVTADKSKRQEGESILMDPGKCRTPDVSPSRNRNRRISHKVESTLFKRSSSSYNNVTIERVIKQKKKTLKKFK